MKSTSNFLKIIHSLAVIALAVIISFSFTSCSDGGGGSGGSGLLDGLQSGDPSSDVLAQYGITAAGFVTDIKTAAGGNYQGWKTTELDGDTYLQFFWTGRSETQCDAVISAIETKLGNITNKEGPKTENLAATGHGTGTMRSGSGGYTSTHRYSVEYAITVCNAWGYEWPKGILYASFFTN